MVRDFYGGTCKGDVAYLTVLQLLDFRFFGKQLKSVQFFWEQIHV